MDPSPRSDAVMELGKQLIQQLGLSNTVDTLARWLAHTLAEKISAVETVPPQERAARQAEVVDLILKLWTHRRHFPRGVRPFEDLEGLATALTLLDPKDKRPHYFGPASPREVQGAVPEAKPW